MSQLKLKFFLALFRFVNGTRLDDRTVRSDWDAGFKEGRQYGRGKGGGQVSHGTEFSARHLQLFNNGNNIESAKIITSFASIDS